jgi:TBC1 domain family protein 5
MHELLAVCLMVVDRDSLDASSTPGPSPVASSPFSPLQRSGAVPSGIPEAMNATLDRTYIEHDAFDLFQELMRPAKSLYEWRTEEATVSDGRVRVAIEG